MNSASALQVAQKRHFDMQGSTKLSQLLLHGAARECCGNQHGNQRDFNLYFPDLIVGRDNWEMQE